MKLSPIIRNKKGAGIPAMFMFLFAIVGIVAVGLFLLNMLGGSKTGSLVNLQVAGQEPAASDGNKLEVVIPAEDVTVTFSTWDFYSKGTNAETGHRILSFDGDIGIQVNDDASRQYSPGDVYMVLLGNITTSLVAGTDYYPVLKQGTLGPEGTQTISAGQYLSAGKGQLTFSYFDENGDTNVDQSIAANGEKKMEWKIVVNDNVCVGNPDTGGSNIASYRYNNTVFSKVVQLRPDGSEEGSVATPNAVNVTDQHSLASYKMPVVCDNADYRVKVLMKTTADATNFHNINITLSDITWDFDADTLVPINGVQDEDNNDIGISDYVVGSLVVS